MIEAHHPFIEQRRTRIRPKKLVTIGEQSNVKSVGGRGNAYRHTKTGRRLDLGEEIYRSAWEANFSRILTMYGVDFEYEPKIFPFPVMKGATAYTPDFYLPKTKEYVELKGWLDTKSATKLKRMKRYHPKEFSTMILVASKYSKAAKALHEKLGFKELVFYEDLEKIYSSIPNWEQKKK